jgi:hypothetical protein
MPVTLNLPPAVEEKLRELAERGGQTLEEFLVRLAVREAETPTVSYPPKMSREEWSKAFREWVESHPRVDHFVDDSRESIYADEGE